VKTKRISTTLLLRSISDQLPKHVFQSFTKSAPSSKLLGLLISLTILALPDLLMAHAGDLDPTFGNNGIVTTANTSANAAALQSDGKIVVAGSISTANNPQQPGLLRYNTNGALDPSFGNGGKASIGGNNAGPVFAVAIQTDGKILAAAPASLHLTVFRFNTNGSVDNTFGTNGAVAIQGAGIFLPPASGDITLQPDGRILVDTRDIVARLLANGQPDSTFGSNGVAPTVGGNSVALLTNGNIVIGNGNVTSLYAPNGSLITNFGINGQTVGFPFDGQGGVVVTTNLGGVTKIITAGTLVTSPSLTFAKPSRASCWYATTPTERSITALALTVAWRHHSPAISLHTPSLSPFRQTAILWRLDRPPSPMWMPHLVRPTLVWRAIVPTGASTQRSVTAAL
jgi:uncharacterized delta-60 repeat protein